MGVAVQRISPNPHACSICLSDFSSCLLSPLEQSTPRPPPPLPGPDLWEGRGGRDGTSAYQN